MTGVLPVVRLMFTALPLQRWFLRISALLALAAAAGSIWSLHRGVAWWPPVAIIGSCVLVVSLPPFVSAVLLRYLAASRAIRLMARGRLRLFVSGCITQLLIGSAAAAAVIGVASSLHFAQRVPTVPFIPYTVLALVFVSVFAVVTLFFITVYVASVHRLGFFVLVAYGIILRAMSVIFPHWPVREFLTSLPALAAIFFGTAGLWLLFAIVFLTAGRIKPPVLSRGDDSLTQWLATRDRHAVGTPSERRAMRILLTGRYQRHYIARSLLGIAAGVLCGYYCLWTAQDDLPLRAGMERLYAVLTAYSGGVAAAAAIYPMTARARGLWLKACLDRRQLFRTVEAEGWRALLSLTGFTLAVCAYFCFLVHVPWPIIVRILLLSFISGAAMLYLILLSTRGWKLLEGSLAAALSALWLIGLIESTFATTGESRLLLLLAPELLLVPLLRGWAKSRWSSIDWLINRPARVPE